MNGCLPVSRIKRGSRGTQSSGVPTSLVSIPLATHCGVIVSGTIGPIGSLLAMLEVRRRWSEVGGWFIQVVVTGDGQTVEHENTFDGCSRQEGNVRAAQVAPRAQKVALGNVLGLLRLEQLSANHQLKITDTFTSAIKLPHSGGYHIQCVQGPKDF